MHKNNIEDQDRKIKSDETNSDEVILALDIGTEFVKAVIAERQPDNSLLL